MNTDTPPAWLDDAVRALHHGIHAEWEAAASFLVNLLTPEAADDTHLIQAAWFWIDNTLHLNHPDLDPDAPIRVVWRYTDDPEGTHHDADAVRPAERWAGQLMGARGARDYEQFAALWNAALAADEDGAFFHNGIAKLLETCATMFRAAGCDLDPEQIAKGA